MRYPLDSITITGAYKEVAQPGTGLPDSAGVKRHIGVDLRAGIGTNVYAVGSGKVTQSYSGTAGQTIEILIGDKLWRFMHLSQRLVSVGQTVTEGQVIAKSGNSGGVAAHLHVDARRNGTTYNASLNNYFDPLALIRDSQVIQGDTMNLSTEAVKSLYRYLFKREGDAGGVKNYTGKTLDFALNDMTKSAEFRAVNTVNNTVTVEKPVTVYVDKVVEKVVEKVIEKPIEVIKEKEVLVEKVVAPADMTMGQLFEALVNKIMGRK